MKQLNITILLTLLISMLGTKAIAHDIEVANEDDVTIYYVWTNNKTELAVSYAGSSSSSYTNEYSGNVAIPETVIYNDVTYPVTSIYFSAFYNCSGLTSVTIPSSVKSIRSYAFSGCSGLTSITVKSGNSIYDSRNNCNAIIETASNTLIVGCKNTIIPNSVTDIGESAFRGCTGLTSINIPNSVTSISRYVFYGCSSLTSIVVASGNSKFDSRNNCNAIIETASNKLIAGCKNTTIPNSVTTIGEDAFYGCSGLTSIEIPNSVTSIYSDAFSNCSDLTSVTIPNSVTNIASHTFYNCSSLTRVIIPSSVTTIGESAFRSCYNLMSIAIPNSVTYIGANAFYDTGMYNYSDYGVFYVDNWVCGYNNTLPYSIVLKQGTVGIADGAFSEYNGAFTVTIPNSMTSIADCAFRDCSGLVKVTIPNSVTSIGWDAFSNCSSMTSIIIPNSVTSIGTNAFYGCSSMTSVTIPNSVTSIGRNAFYNCNSLSKVFISDLAAWCNIVFEQGAYANPLMYAHHLYLNEEEVKELVIPNSVTSIGAFSFYNCSSLKNVTIPSSVTTIGMSAFAGCSNLAGISFLNSLTSIGRSAFYGCSSLLSVTIPSSVNNIGDYAFAECSSLNNVNVESASPISIYSNTFTNRSNAILYVPHGSKAAYEEAEYWKDFSDIIEMGAKCNTPVIAIENGEIVFSCETDGVTYVSSVSFADDNMHQSNKIPLATTLRISVYAKKEGYFDSDVATMDIDFKALSGDVNNDGEITISDAVAIVEIILNSISKPEPKFYYSVGTEEVTADNYTTANGAQYKNSLTEIPETLDLSAITQQQAYILLPEGCVPIIRSASGIVGTTSVSLGNGHTVHTTTSAINGSECTCTVYK